MSNTTNANLLPEDTGRVKIRNRRLQYHPLRKFDPRSCNIVNIEMPEIEQSVVHSVRFTSESATSQYHGAELRQIVKFRVSYMPLDSNEGHELLPFAKKLVEDVLKDGYEPATASITQTGKDSNTIIAQRTIESCVITGAEIEIDAGDYVRITFDLQGIDNPASRV